MLAHVSRQLEIQVIERRVAGILGNKTDGVGVHSAGGGTDEEERRADAAQRPSCIKVSERNKEGRRVGAQEGNGIPGDDDSLCRCIRGAHQATVFIPVLRFVASRHFRSAFPITITTARINTMPDILR